MAKYFVPVSENMLIAIFEDEFPGIKLTKKEARTILGYFSGSDYALDLDVLHRQLVQRDVQGVDDLEELDTLADVVTFCADINFDLTEQEKSSVLPDEGQMKKLKADLKSLDRLIEYMGQ